MHLEYVEEILLLEMSEKHVMMQCSKELTLYPCCIGRRKDVTLHDYNIPVLA